MALVPKLAPASELLLGAQWALLSALAWAQVWAHEYWALLSVQLTVQQKASWWVLAWVRKSRQQR